MRELPLGVFDSGLGGLTVVRAIRAALPHESIVYLGDTARVPYGTRSASTVVRYALGCAKTLLQHRVKALVVACNTVSAVALERLRADLDLPVLGVIVPGATAAVHAASEGPIGVLGTAGTINSGAYTRAISMLNTRVEVLGRPAPLLVAMAEEGWLEGEVPRLVVRRYLEPLVERRVRAVLLGCTHFPVFSEIVREEVAAMSGGAVPVVDSASATATALGAFLSERGLAATGPVPGALRIMVSDHPQGFRGVAARFLGEEPPEVSTVDL